MRQILVTLLLVTSLIPVASAQLPNFSPDWDFGWEDDADVAILQLDSKTYSFELVLEFFVENTYPMPITLDLESELSDANPSVEWEIDHPTQISAPANSNETHEVKITGSGQYCQSGECTFWSANDNFLTELSLTATFTVADQPQSDKEITKKLKPSSIYGFEVWFEPLINGKGPLVKSGTTEEVDVYIGLSGNSNDAISKIDMSFRSCPQMDFNSENSGLVAGTSIGGDGSGQLKGTIVLSAPSSHRGKDCKFLVTATSEGNGRSYSGELEFTVEDPGEKVSEESETESNSNTTSELVETDSLPAISGHILVIIVLFSALFRRE